MSFAPTPDESWHQLRERLHARGLWPHDAALALRLPGQPQAWWGEGAAGSPRPLRLDSAPPPGAAGVAWRVLHERPDVLAAAACAGPAGRALVQLQAPLPQCFDEQARHLGPFVHARADTLAVALALRGQSLAVGERLWCLAPTVQRLALNAELLEKCATAALLAWGASGSVPALPAWVRWIANRRLHRDQRHAAQALAQGELPADVTGY